jgi:hypothetical protein
MALLKAALYDWFGLNTALFQAINGDHGTGVETVMQVGSTLADYWNFPWIASGLSVWVVRCWPGI